MNEIYYIKGLFKHIFYYRLRPIWWFFEKVWVVVSSQFMSEKQLAKRMEKRMKKEAELTKSLIKGVIGLGIGSVIFGALNTMDLEKTKANKGDTKDEL